MNSAPDRAKAVPPSPESRWPLIRLTDVGKDDDAFADGPFGSNLKTEHYTSSGARVIRLQNIGSGHFLDADKAYISLKHFERLARHSVQDDDIVVAALGDGARPAGRACLVPVDLGPALVKADCFRVRLPRIAVYGPFLVAVMNSPQFLKQVADRIRGATRPRMTLGILRDCRVPLPAIDEQRRVAATLIEQMVEVERARAAVRAQTEVIDTLPAALLRRAFSGAI